MKKFTHPENPVTIGFTEEQMFKIFHFVMETSE